MNNDKFTLDDSFVSEYSKKKPEFGFNGLGELVYLRTYSRLKESGENEKWFETIKRVVEGTYNIQREQIDSLCLGWNPEQAQRSAQEMYSRMFDMKFLPPGRGLWTMGTDIIGKKGLAAALNNCGFVSTKDMGTTEPFSKPFAFLQDMCMLGVGIGFDTLGAGNFVVTSPTDQTRKYLIPDTREGWVNSTKLLIESFNNGDKIKFDYSGIRKEGVPLKTFGGVSSGPQPLIDLHVSIEGVLMKNVNKPVSVTTIVDIMNLIGKCVVSGNVRRCLPKGTLIHTQTGLIPIESVQPGTMVYTSSGLAPTSELVHQGIQEVLTIITELGVFECTPKHKMAIMDLNEELNRNYSNKRDYSWKMAKDLIASEDYLVFPYHLMEGKDTCIYYNNKEYIQVTETIAYFFGYFSGIDYSVNADLMKTNILSGRSESDVQLFNRFPNEYLELFEDFIKSTDYGLNMYLPKFILDSKESVKKSFIDGLEYSNYVQFNIILNFQFLKDIQALYSSIGIPITIINGTIKRFYTELGGTPRIIGNNLFVKVVGIINTGNIVDTYDISVPGAEEFIAAEGLLVHNTAEIAFGSADSNEFMDLKDYSKNPERMDYGWTSNNSIFAELGMDYSEVSKRININGEPGLAWLDNMRKYSRMVDPPDNKDYRVMGGNPCLEQSLETYELCCVTKYTRIQTEDSCPMIGDVVGIPIKVWNGNDWSVVTPFKTGTERDIFRVVLSDGSYLDCTDNHKWSILGNILGSTKEYSEIQTKYLKVGSYVENFTITTPPGINTPIAYSLGVFMGYGYIIDGVPMITMYSRNKDIFDKLYGYKNEYPRGSGNYSVDLCENIEIELANKIKNKHIGLPDFIFTFDKESIFKFVAGLIDSRGYLVSPIGKNESFEVIGYENKIRDLQILLRRAGINHATIRLFEKKPGNVNLYTLRIPDYESLEIPTVSKKLNKYSDPPKMEYSQKIIKIIELKNKQDTYCFTEPINHKGVFGNVLTHQCLVETFPTRADSFNDYLRTLKFAYLYAKTVTLGMTHWPETNRVQLRNRRIGCSVSGIAQFLSNNNLNTLNKWLDSGYHEIQKWDRVYSEWLCIPRSIKTTSIKPSGTVSLLAGATPGMHYPESRFYIRRMRLANGSPLIKPLLTAGYKVEPAVGSESSTSVVEIPVDAGEGIRTVNDVSMWEQVALAANLQRWWADNQVSCTVTFNPKTEGLHIASALDYFQYQLKGISFLPKCDYGAFPQMPYEEISESEYSRMCSSLKVLNIDGMSQDSVGEQFCDGDSCVKN